MPNWDQASGSATNSLAPQIFGVNTDGLRDLCGPTFAALPERSQRRLAGDSPYKYIGESLDSEEEERDLGHRLCRLRRSR